MDFRDWHRLFRAALQHDEGQTMAEYGVVLAVVTVGIILALGALAVAISGRLDSVTSFVTSITP
jgi:Flp pilus assembly pilin Flp